MSLGADNYNNDGWQQWQQGWGDHWGMMGRGMGMYNSGRNSPRMMGNGNSSPRGGSPYNGNYGNNYMGGDMNRMGSYRPESASRHPNMGGMSGEHWKYNKPGYGSPYGSPRGATNMPHGSMA